MRTTIELLDAVKAKTGAASDYAVAPKLGVTRAAVSNYRNGKSYMDDEVAEKVAEILGVSLILVLATVHAERARSEKAKKAWAGIIDKLGGTAAAVAVGIMLTALPPFQTNASAAGQVRDINPPNIHYTKRRRRQRGILADMVAQLMNRPRLA